jgi:hypothetical protein
MLVISASRFPLKTFRLQFDGIGFAPYAAKKSTVLRICLSNGTVGSSRVDPPATAIASLTKTPAFLTWLELTVPSS